MRRRALCPGHERVPQVDCRSITRQSRTSASVRESPSFARQRACVTRPRAHAGNCCESAGRVRIYSWNSACDAERSTAGQGERLTNCVLGGAPRAGRGAQAKHQAASEPAARFLASACAHVCHRDRRTWPDVTEARRNNPRNDCGWRRDSHGEWSPRGNCIGWVDGDDIYLEPTPPTRSFKSLVAMSAKSCQYRSRR